MKNLVIDFFFFEKMLIPKILTTLYWISILVVLISGIIFMSSGFGGLTFGRFLAGLAIMVCGVLSSRISCELLIVLFKINENLANLNGNSDSTMKK